MKRILGSMIDSTSTSTVSSGRASSALKRKNKLSRPAPSSTSWRALGGSRNARTMCSTALVRAYVPRLMMVGFFR
eukprot:7550547-Prorocentrum_lima.AAC.1